MNWKTICKEENVLDTYFKNIFIILNLFIYIHMLSTKTKVFCAFNVVGLLVASSYFKFILTKQYIVLYPF